MNISATFIRKPIATGMLVAAILQLGLISYELLPVVALPNIDSPTILVTANFREPMRRLLPAPSPRRSAAVRPDPLSDTDDLEQRHRMRRKAESPTTVRISL